MIRKMQSSDWARVKAIYEQALAKGVSTFNTVCPDYTQWDSGHLAPGESKDSQWPT